MSVYCYLDPGVFMQETEVENGAWNMAAILSLPNVLKLFV